MELVAALLDVFHGGSPGASHDGNGRAYLRNNRDAASMPHSRMTPPCWRI